MGYPIDGIHPMTLPPGPRGKRLSRRDFLRRSGWSSAALATAPFLPGCGSAGGIDAGRTPDGSGTAAFGHGVASGDPLSDRVIVWTRVTPADAAQTSVSGTCILARDAAFTEGVMDLPFATTAARDFTVKLDPAGLMPGTTYYDRFTAQGVASPVGRTRTLPVGAVDRLRFGVVSCSSLAHGFFNAYRFVAERADLDAVLHLGDYIYEYGNGEYGDARTYEPPGEILSLEDYRTRYAHYRLDPDLAEAHRQHPFIVIWDDHESTNNSWRDNAENHTERTPDDDGDGEGCWVQRKAWAIQAYREWLPIRDNLPDYVAPAACDDPLEAVRKAAQERIYRRFDFGDLVTLTMLDTRLIGRDQPRRPNLSTLGPPTVAPDTDSRNTDNDQLDTGLFDACAAPYAADYSMLGAAQKQWLFDQLGQTAARWRLIGQQVMMGQLKVVGAPEPLCALPGSDDVLALLPASGTPLDEALNVIRNNLPALGAGRSIYLNADQWDGYPVERRALFDFFSANAFDNVVVLTGDIHTSWAIDLTPDPNNLLAYNPLTGQGAVGVEFVCTSVTSPGLEPLDQASDLLRLNNPHMKFIDLARRGYMVMDITPERTQGEWWYVSTIAERGGSEQLGAAFLTAHGQPGIVAAEAASTPRNDAPPLAP